MAVAMMGQSKWQTRANTHASSHRHTSGTAIRGRRAAAPRPAQSAILARLGLEGEAFIQMAAHLLREFGSAVGAPAQLARVCARRQTRFLHGMRAARRVFG